MITYNLRPPHSPHWWIFVGLHGMSEPPPRLGYYVATMQILIQDASSAKLLISGLSYDSWCLCWTKFVTKDNKRSEKKTLTGSEDYLGD